MHFTCTGLELLGETVDNDTSLQD